MNKVQDTIRIRSSHPLLEGKQVFFEPNNVPMGHRHNVAGKNTVSMAVNSMARNHIGYREEEIVKNLYSISLESHQNGDIITAELMASNGSTCMVIVYSRQYHHKPGEVVG